MYDEWVCYIYNNYVWWMGMLYIIIMYDEWVCGYIIITHVWWMGMLYWLIMVWM